MKPPAQLPECGWSPGDQAAIKPINFIASKYQAHNININSGNGCESQTVDGKISNVKVPGNQVEKLDKQTVSCQVEKKFVGHFTPPNGEGASIAHGFFDVSACIQKMLQMLISKYFFRF